MQTVFIPFNLVLNYGSEANRSPSPCLLQMEAVEAIRLGCPRNKQNKISVRTETNRNKPKQNLFWLCFGLFYETKNKKIQFVSVCFVVSDLYWNNRNKEDCLETNPNNPKFSRKYSKICFLSNCFGCSSIFFGSIETLCFGIEEKQTFCFG